MKQADQRDSFVFYRSFYNSIIRCPNEVQLELFRAVADYALNQVLPEFKDSEYKPFVDAIWEGIKPQLDANIQRYVNGCKGAQYGKLGGAPKGNQNALRKQPQNNPKTTPNENDNVNVNGNENEKIIDLLNVHSLDFVNTWKELLKQPNWKRKPKSALIRCINKLSHYRDDYAVELMEEAIMNQWKGVVFSNTDQRYKEWLSERSRNNENVISTIEQFEQLNKQS